MSNRKQHKLENTAAALQQRFGAQALRKASNLTQSVVPPHISTGFPALDAITGCQGVPLGDITLLSGYTTSGKLTLAYKTLMNAQGPARANPCEGANRRFVESSQGFASQGLSSALVAIVDLNHSADPDYLARAGVDLEHALIARPAQSEEAVGLLLDLARTQNLRAILVDNLADLLAVQGAGSRLQATVSQLRHLLRSANCALLFVDEASPPWRRRLRLDQSAVMRQHAALHIEMRRESWIAHQQDMVGYCARAHILHSRWARGCPSVPVDIRFNGSIMARQTW